MELLDSRGLVAGEWQHAADGKTFDVCEPSTGKVLYTVANFGREDFVKAIDHAYEGCQRDFGKTTAKERAEMLSRWNALILKNEHDRMHPPLSPTLTP
jgi:succinate-semialdehyde dehydrogenase / glutarate-semialdehyde dehydrogenase